MFGSNGVAHAWRFDMLDSSEPQIGIQRASVDDRKARGQVRVGEQIARRIGNMDLPEEFEHQRAARTCSQLPGPLEEERAFRCAWLYPKQREQHNLIYECAVQERMQ